MTTLTYGPQKKKNHAIPIVDALEFDAVDVGVDPYVMGLLLGDGCLRTAVSISSVDDEIIESCRSEAGKFNLSLVKRGESIDYYFVGEYAELLAFKNEYLLNSIFRLK